MSSAPSVSSFHICSREQAHNALHRGESRVDSVQRMRTMRDKSRLLIFATVFLMLAIAFIWSENRSNRPLEAFLPDSTDYCERWYRRAHTFRDTDAVDGLRLPGTKFQTSGATCGNARAARAHLQHK